MNIPLLDRLKSMYSAEKNHEYDDDPLATYMFNTLKEYGEYDHLSYDLYVRDTIEDCLTYINEDRPRQINELISEELKGNDTSEGYSDLESQDIRVMTQLVKIRKYIFK